MACPTTQVDLCGQVIGESAEDVGLLLLEAWAPDTWLKVGEGLLADAVWPCFAVAIQVGTLLCHVHLHSGRTPRPRKVPSGLCKQRPDVFLHTVP